jgi:oxazoline/thiazoline dehydrogenase
MESPDRATLSSANTSNTSSATYEFANLTTSSAQALQHLAQGGITRTELRQWTAANGTVQDVLRVEREVNVMLQLRWLLETVDQNSERIASRTRLSAHFHVKPIDVAQRYVPSRFAFLHHADGQLILESPLSHAIITFWDWRGAAVFNALQHSALPEIGGLSLSTVRNVIALLAESSFLTAVGDNGLTNEQHSDTLREWEFHDLLFHSRSRIGRNVNPTGATYRFRGEIEHLPAIKPPMVDIVVALPVPNIETLMNSDPSLAWVMENRRSQRTSDHPLTIEQIGEFLYRTSRAKAVYNNGDYEVSSRPYPAGGAIYEIELYTALHGCVGIENGFYHYCPQRHVLERLQDQSNTNDKLMNAAQMATGLDKYPHMLIVMSARFQRLAWKYEGFAYALMLKHVGIIHQTFYLAATAMGISACAIGTGNPDLFCSAAGTNYYEESSVGEFMLC